MSDPGTDCCFWWLWDDCNNASTVTLAPLFTKTSNITSSSNSLPVAVDGLNSWNCLVAPVLFDHTMDIDINYNNRYNCWSQDGLLNVGKNIIPVQFKHPMVNLNALLAFSAHINAFCGFIQCKLTQQYLSFPLTFSHDMKNSNVSLLHATSFCVCPSACLWLCLISGLLCFHLEPAIKNHKKLKLAITLLHF